MKTLTNLLTALAVVLILFSGCAKDGKDGVNGINGTNGTNGVNVTASVYDFSLTFSNESYKSYTMTNYSYSTSNTTLVFVKDFLGDYFMLPYSDLRTAYDNSSDFTNIVGFYAEASNSSLIFIHSFDASKTGSYYLNSKSITGSFNFRAVVVPGTLKSNKSFKSYEEVKAYYHLID